MKISNNKLLNRLLLLVIFIIYSGFSYQISAQTIYTWQGGNGDWTVSTNWSPERTTPANNDVLQFNDGGTYEVINISTQTIGKLLITNNTDVTLQSNSTTARYIYISGPGYENNLTIEDGSTLQISEINNLIIRPNANYQYFDISGNLNVRGGTFYPSAYGTTRATVSATGVINHYGGIITSTTATLEFQEDAVYNYMSSTTALTLPTATWHPKSYLYFPEITTVSPTVSTATSEAAGLGTVIWDCANQTDVIGFANNTTYIKGDFIVKNTGTSTLGLSTGGNRSIFVLGDFIVEGGDVYMHNETSRYTYLYIVGNLTQSGGNFERGSSTGIQRIYFRSNGLEASYTKSGGTYDGTGINYYVENLGILIFESDLDIAAGRTFYVNNGGEIRLNTDISVTGTLYNYGTVKCATHLITGTGTFTHYNANYTHLYIGSPDGITTAGNASGNIQTNTRNYGTTVANYIYYGNVPQVTGNGLPAKMTTLTIDNPAGVSLTSDITNIASSLILNQGILNIGSNNITLAVAATVSGNPLNASNMVVADGSGQFIKNYSAGYSPAFVFPIGDNTGTAEFSPVSIGINNNDAAGWIGVRLVDDTHPDNGAAINYLSRYFVFTTSMTSYNYNLSFDYTASNINGLENQLKYSRWDGTNWSVFTSSASSNTMTVSNALTETNAPLTATNQYTGREGEFNYYRSVQTGDWSDIATWEVSSDPAFIAPAPVPATEAPSAINSIKVTVRAGHTVTISGSDLSTTINELQVYGNLENTTTGTNINFLSGIINFEAGSNYYHNRNGGRIPEATWNITSNCYITGITNTNPTYHTSLPFNVSNLIWDNPSQTATGIISTPTQINIAGDLTVLRGTLNFSNKVFSVAGDVTNSATIHSSSGTLNMNGTSQQTISGSGIWTTGTEGRLYALTINNPAGVVNNCNFAIQFNLTLTDGTISGAGKIILGIGSGTLYCYRTNGNIDNAFNIDYYLNGVTYNLYYLSLIHI